MKEYPEIEEQFCVELQELLDRYKVQLSVPTIMRNAQKIFHVPCGGECVRFRDLCHGGGDA